MKIKCPQCGTVFFVDENEFEEGKKKVKCPGCGKILLIKIKKKESKEEKEIPDKNSTTANNDLFGKEETEFPSIENPGFEEPSFNEENLFGGAGESSLFSEEPSEETFSSTDEELFGDIPPPEDIGDFAPVQQPEKEENLEENIFGDEELFSHSDSEIKGLYGEEKISDEEDFPDFDWEDEEERKASERKPESEGKTNEKAAPPVNENTLHIEESKEEEEDELKPLIDEEEAESFLEEAIVRTSEEKEAKKSPKWVTALLFLLLVVVAGIYIAYRYFPDELPVRNYINSLFQPPQKPDQYHDLDPSTRILAVKIKRMINARGDRLLIFYGRVQNRSRQKISYIKLRIYLLNPDKKPVIVKDFYAGNTFSEEELKLLSPEQIEDRQNNKFGETFINESVPPGKVIPFMGIIINPPPFSEFRVVTLSSLPGG